MSDKDNKQEQKEQDHVHAKPLQEEGISLDKDKINQVLDSFLQEQEQAKERERQKEEKLKKEKKRKKILRTASVIGVVLFVLLLIALNPNTKQIYNKYKEAQRPREEYSLEYNYSPGMKILPMGPNLVMYDSNNLKLLKKTGEEVFDIPFALGSWDLAASGKAIYLLDRIDNVLYFIDPAGNFANKVELANIPHKLYAGKGGNVVLHYRSESGVEGAIIFDKSGKELNDTSYPKTTITFINVSDEDKVTIHGMLRTAQTIENSVYRYSDKGNLIFSNNYEDVVFFRQYEDSSTIIFVDINKIQFYSKNTNENTKSVSSLVPIKLVTFDKDYKKLYVLDSRNKLRIINLSGSIMDEKHFQTQYDQILAYKDELLMVGEDFIRTSTREIRTGGKIEEVFLLEDYLAIVTKDKIKLLNKLD